MQREDFEVIVIGGSYSGLSAAMALGRSLRRVLIIDGGKRANRFTPHSHNFITHDGSKPEDIAFLAKAQVLQYETVSFKSGFVIQVHREETGFLVTLGSGEEYLSKKIVLATGIIDLMVDIPGYEECWGKSVLHCPYCHGYEVRHAETAILGNGDYAYEFGILISNWTKRLSIFTNGKSTLTEAQKGNLSRHNIDIIEDRLVELYHTNGMLNHVNFENGVVRYLSTIYSKPQFMQHSGVSSQLGCELTNEGYIKTDQWQRTTVPGVFACGDNVTRLRTVSNAVSLGTIAGMMLNKEFIAEQFE